MGITRSLVDSIDAMMCAGPTPEARIVARHCVLDWFGVALAGSREPLSQILVRELAAQDSGGAALVGRAERTSPLQAALINGAASHALDFDDTHTLMSGHPSVPVVPAALTLAEGDDRDGATFLNAVIAGVEMECRLGALVNPGHYALGFHATGTLGTFGAAMAAARMLGLDRDQTLHALGLAGTQASGLKSAFGTMAKPLHAGHAAANGLLAALLARGGFTGNPAILEAEQGFASTHGAGECDPSGIARLDGRFLIRDTLFKYHASCYLTHAPIEAASLVRAQVGSDTVESVELRASEACIGVCDIANPVTGLEGKFSLRATTAMALLGDDTAAPASFNDARMASADLRALRDRVTFAPQPGLPSTQAAVIVRAGGRTLSAEADTGRPAEDLDRQWETLSAKFFSLAAPVIGRAEAERLHAALATIEDARSMRDVIALARGDDDGRGSG